MAAQCFQWSDEADEVKEFYAKFCTSLPQIVIVEQGFYGTDENESFGSGQVIRIQTMRRFTRVLGKDCKGRMLSIPIDYPMKIHIKQKRNKRPVDQSIADTIMDNKLPIKVQFSENETSFASGRKEHSAEFGIIELQQTFDEKMLLGNIITVSDGMSQEVVQVAHRANISLRVAVALADGSRAGLDQYMEALNEVAKGFEFDTAKFHNEISVYSVDVKAGSPSVTDILVSETSSIGEIAKAKESLSAEWHDTPEVYAENEATNLAGTWSIYDTELPKRVKSKQLKSRRSLTDTISKYIGKFFTSSTGTDNSENSERKSIDSSGTDDEPREAPTLPSICVNNRGMFSLENLFVNPSETVDDQNDTNEANTLEEEKPIKKKPATLPKPGFTHRPRSIPPSDPIPKPTIDNASINHEKHIPNSKSDIDHDSGNQEHESDTQDSSSAETKLQARSLPIPCPQTSQPTPPFSWECSGASDRVYLNMDSLTLSHRANPKQPQDTYDTAITPEASAIYDDLEDVRCENASLLSDRSENRNYVVALQREQEYETTYNHANNDIRKKPFSDMTMRDVAQCLIALRLEKFVDKFLNEGIDGVIFKELDKDTLKEDLGMSKIDIIKITKFVQNRHIPS